ncbi:hypothetical protein Tco_0827302 [Tanacetum coccineum]
MDSFQRLTLKIPHHGMDLWLQAQIFYDHVNPATRRTIDQSAREKRLSSLGTQLKKQQDDVINKINTLWRVVSEKFDNTPAHNTVVDFTARVNANRNCSSPKRVYFVKTITIIRKEDEPKKEKIVEPNEAKKNDHIAIAEMKEKEGEDESRDIRRDDPDNRARGDTKGVDEVDEESEESEREVEEEVKEEEEEE